MKTNAPSLSRNLLLYLVAGAFWSCGLMAYFLVYNLYLSELGQQEAVMGTISGAMTLGSLFFTFPAGWLLGRFGTTRVIQGGVAGTGLTLFLRAVSESSWLLVLLAFVNGSAIAAWMVSSPPFLTQNASPSFRSRAFSLSYGTSIGMGAISGFAVGGIYRFLVSSGKAAFGLSLLSIERVILISCVGCVLVAFAVLLLLRENRLQPYGQRLSTPNPDVEAVSEEPKIELARSAGVLEPFARALKDIQSRRFLARLLITLTLWSLFVGSFSPFFNIFFHRRFNQSLEGIGIIFSFSQICQFLAVLSMPWFVIKLGQVRAIALMQMLAAVFLPVLLLTTEVRVAGLIYLTYLSFQVMSEPALENFIMDSVLPEERSFVSSLRYMILFLMQALAVWGSGFAIVRFGYAQLLVILAVIGAFASLLFYLSFEWGRRSLEIARGG